jgi:ribokinase
VDFVVKDHQAPSGVALIIVDDKGQNSIAVASGANSNLSISDVEAAADAISSAAFVLMQLEIPIETVAAAARMAADKNVRVILNPAPAQSLGDELLKNVTIITPNETEASMLTGIKVEDQSSACRAAETLVSKGVKSVIITMGSAGAYVHCDDFHGMVPGFKVEAVDTTAAGDTFSGTLAVALAEGRTLEQATVFANAAAALSVTKLGAQPSAPDRAAIEKFQKERKR